MNEFGRKLVILTEISLNSKPFKLWRCNWTFKDTISYHSVIIGANRRWNSVNWLQLDLSPHNLLSYYQLICESMKKKYFFLNEQCKIIDSILINSCNKVIKVNGMCNLISFVQSEKREKLPWSNATFSKVFFQFD